MSLLSSLKIGGARPPIDSDLSAQVAARIASLMQTISGREVVATEFTRIRDLFSQMPPSADADSSKSRLNRAQRYFRSDEIGSALYELQLLAQSLACRRHFDPR